MNPRKAGEGQVEARIVQVIKERGPRNVALISRQTGVPVETVRYKIAHQLPGLGFRIHAEPDYGKLGLVLHWGRLRFGAPFEGSAGVALRKLNEAGYLVYYARIIPAGYYACLFALPLDLVAEHVSLLDHLAELGVLRSYELKQVTYGHHFSLDPKYFNFRTGRWEVDWGGLDSKEPAFEARERRPSPAGIDRYDLLLVKELQIDSLRHNADIAQKLGIPPPVLGYHMRTHVEEQGLIDRYIVRWMQDVTKTLAHAVMVTRLVATELDGRQMSRARAVVGRIPFAWSEYTLEDGTFVSTLCIPVEEAITTFDYIHGRLADIGDKIEVGFVKPSDAHSFTIPYNMYDRGWTSGVEGLRSNLIRLVRATKKVR
ncbi:MAG TPA: Lrp/AsnC family transcriptional regulator [Conexivisphaerales archaeon]|nr:Lrp/AsnC family transcriptional regulator [Conexivisphaerales archaeon]